MRKHSVTFSHSGKTVEVEDGTVLISALEDAGFNIPSNCGGHGLCGKCRIRIITGRVENEPNARISSDDRKSGIYLACRTLIRSDLTVEVPSETSNADSEPQGESFPGDRAVFQKKTDLFLQFTLCPLIVKHHLVLEKPTLNDPMSDFERILRQLHGAVKQKKEYRAELSFYKELPLILRKSGWDVTATLNCNEEPAVIVDLEAGNTADKNYGLVVDVGTTTVSVGLVDLVSGDVINRTIDFNRQSAYGEDIISRIIYSEKTGGMERLNKVICETINDIVSFLLREAGLVQTQVNSIVMAGNMTMMHLLLKVPPSFLRREPYVAVSRNFPAVKASEIGLKSGKACMAFTVPGAYPYVGGDITAGILVSELYKKDSVSLFIDLGTNGEIVLGNREWLMCCAASAGPSFEGSGVKNGMRAVQGAVQSVRIEGEEVLVNTIGGKKPEGICGSGYVDLLYELFRNRIIDRSGNLRDSHKRVREAHGEHEFLVVDNAESATGKDIIIASSDIENLLRAKGAVFAAITIMLKHAGVQFAGLENIFLAGGFGNYVDVGKAVAIGLLPDIPVSRIKFLGNSSLQGALFYLLDREMKVIFEEIVSKMTYIELSGEKDYMDEYVKSLFLPHTQIELFPSVKEKLFL